MPDFKEKADTILSTAIDVLKPHNKYQQPFADVPDNGLHHSPPMNSYSNHQNKTASGAFTELMETIKKISPTVLDNIREKLNNLGHN
uniref:Uncharacterized protein n=1 Tax=Panagrolaimus sp. PS1159 TaxID=55785 RepID=A0AC35GIX7_9BILA